MNDKCQILRTFLIIAIASLFLAIIPVWPYRYYILLRLVVCGTVSYLAYRIYKEKELEQLKANVTPLIIVAVLFNPIIPVYLIRLIWLPIDIGIGLYLFVILNKLKSL